MIKSLLSTLSIIILCVQNSSAQTFTESSVALGVTHEHIDSNLMGGGAAFFDFNNDGWEDIYITGGDNRDQLFENDHTGNFNEIGIAAGLGFTDSVKTNGVIAGDINDDFNTDLFITTSEGYPNILLFNNGDGTFTDISIAAGIVDSVWSMSASFGDFNRDGHLDIHCGNYVKYSTMPFYSSIFGGYTNNLYLNNGNNTFTDIANISGTINTGSTLATTFTDFDSDYDVDLIVGNDFGLLYGGNALYENDGSGTNFSNISTSSGIMEEINSMGIAIGDFDEDLDLDYYISNMAGNIHHVNNFDGTFTEDAFNAGIETTNSVSWGTFYFDYDNDTYLDLFVANGGIMGAALPQPNVLYQNQLNGTFSDVAITEGIEDTLRSRGAIYGDIDNDGDLDVLVVNTEMDSASGQNISLYKNNTDGAQNWVKIKLEGVSSNKNAFGAQIEVRSNGRSWIREISGGSSYLSQSSHIAHFGLGSYTDIDTILVRWPYGWTMTVLNEGINQTINIPEFTISGINEFNAERISIFPNPSSTSISIRNESSASITRYKIYSMDGKLIQEGKLSGITNQIIDIQNITTGIYNMELSSTNQIINKKISIVH
jgi:hypothetical protein